MLAILKSPFPCTYGQKQNFYVALSIGIFVSFFLLVFEPFGIADSDNKYRSLRTAGFGVVSFLVLLFYYFVFPKIFKNYFSEKSYTLGKDMLASAGLILFVALGNGLYAQFFLHENAFESIWILIWQTFLVGIFPLSFLSLLQFNRKLKANIKASKEIELPNRSIESIQQRSNEAKFLFISEEQEKKQIPLDDLLYLESDGNYAFLNQIKDGVVSKTLHRTTLKSIESDNKFSNIQRCHRSFIVNLNQVVEINGNAQGLKLSLQNCDEIVPVSKKYIPVIKNYFKAP